MTTVSRGPTTSVLPYALAAAIIVGAGCSGSVERNPSLTRPPPFVVPPVTRVVDRADILFDVDNSSSMGDKQAYLAAAIPDLLNRLINPNCVDPAGHVAGPSANGTCTVGFTPEFPPLNDLHLGIVTSSLGPRGGDACNAATMAQAPFQNVSAHNDDQAHLVNRSLTFAADGGSVVEGVVADAPASDPLPLLVSGCAERGQDAGARKRDRERTDPRLRLHADGEGSRHIRVWNRFAASLTTWGSDGTAIQLLAIA